jgi:hypothetical protein
MINRISAGRSRLFPFILAAAAILSLVLIPVRSLKAQRPSILRVTEAIHPDSIRSNILSLQAFGSRFKLLENRRAIAEWLASRFRSYGLTEVTIDSFYCHVARPADTALWQYNVVARIPGSSAPGEEDLIGAHYDSYSNQNLYTNAPGADDNGSGTAAVLEIARAMQQEGYRPETTVTFALFAAEELGGQGSEYMAGQARMTGREIRLMLNLDMIAFNPGNLPVATLYRFQGAASAAQLTADAMEDYTGLEVSIPPDSTNNESDSYFFWLNGFPTAFLFEPELSPFWHTSSDTLGTCNAGYAAEVTRGACATLMEDQFLPYPRSFTAHSAPGEITLTWKSTANAKVAGYNIYRSRPPDTTFTRINTAPVTASTFTDLTALKGTEYHYFATTLNSLAEESIPSEKARGIRISFSDTLLVIASVKDNTSTPDSVFRFYEGILDTIPFEWHDAGSQNPVTLQMIGTHRNVWWMANVFNYTPGLHPSAGELGDFFANGGNMLLTAFLPALLMDRISERNTKLPEGAVLRDFFSADSVIRKPSAFMFRAYPSAPGWDTLRIDPDKEVTAGFHGELQNIEVYTPATEGTICYRFDSHYAPTTPMGLLQDRPVGMENSGEAFKTILLSFPLYYCDTSGARTFIRHVVRDLFANPAAIPALESESEIILHPNFPNPFAGQTTILLSVRKPGDAALSVYSGQGSQVREIFRGNLDAGEHTFRFSADGLPAGLYSLVLTTANRLFSVKMCHVE